MSSHLRTLAIADPPERWTELGFTVVDGSAWVGPVELRLGQPGEGIVGWRLDPPADIDGLPTIGARAPGVQSTHPNGALAVDHVVVLTPDFERSAAALAAAGLELRQVRQVPERGSRQGFRRLGPAILELVEAPDIPPGPARFWGLVVVVDDLDALAARLGDRLGRVKRAVQAGRRIATLRAGAGVSPAVAFMDPDAEPRPGAQPHG